MKIDLTCEHCKKQFGGDVAECCFDCFMEKVIKKSNQSKKTKSQIFWYKAKEFSFFLFLYQIPYWFIYCKFGVWEALTYTAAGLYIPLTFPLSQWLAKKF
jgi:hypothetical protein